jgi:hypothetical protein
MPLPRACILALLFSSAVSPASATVLQVAEVHRKDLGTTGYEEITATLHFEIDPTLAGNAVIADVALAPVTAAGRVRFSSDLRLFKPKNPTQSNGAAWLEIPNRGGQARLTEWMIKQGFTVVNVGWEFDVPSQVDKLNITVPAARNPDGSPIRGIVSATFTLDQALDEHTLSDLAEYPAVDLAGPDSKLIVRDRTAFPGGQELPRAQWHLEGNRIHLEGGFEPGKTYEVFYLAEAPPIAGLGYAAIRDAVAWLKHDATSLAPVQRVYAFGSSQCGRLLRDFLYLGFNTDEQDRIALDGVIAHVAGAGRLVLNQRWSTPRSVAGYATASYPFADRATPDPVSDHAEGILENPRVKHRPKVFYTNMAAEYWGAGRVAALTHAHPEGTQDIDLPAEVRSYFFASTSHGAAPFPPTSQVPGSPLANPVNTAAAIQALRLAMHQWVTEDKAPPASVYPKLSDGTLTPITELRFPEVPGMAAPNAVTAGGRVRNPQWPDGAGEGAALPLLVPQADADGNDRGGILMPEVAVPVATATGWVFRPSEFGAPTDFYLLRGAWVPFAVSKAQRLAANDPRPSLEERYPSKAAYLKQVRAAAEHLIAQRLLLPEDLEAQIQLASTRWDWVISQANP